MVFFKTVPLKKRCDPAEGRESHCRPENKLLVFLCVVDLGTAAFWQGTS